jgi:D-lactate dehydrogenase
MLTVVYDTKPYDRESLSREVTARQAPIEFRFHNFRLTAQTAPTVSGAVAVCAFVSDTIDRNCIVALASEGVKLIAMRCTGYNNVDVVAAKEFGVTVTRVPVYSTYAVAEHAIALLLTLNRKTHRAFNRVREFNFSLNGLVGVDLHGKTAGIIGTGKIGKITAGILRGFGMRVVAFDPFPDAQWAAASNVEMLSIEDVSAQSDVISLHVPLLPQTHHVICTELISRMKPGVIILNVSRGGLVDTKALIDGLKSGHVGGVGLDVYEEEEGIFFEDLSGAVMLDDDLARLLSFPNVVVTSHQAFLTREALEDIARTTVQNLAAHAEGRPYLDGSVLTIDK